MRILILFIFILFLSCSDENKINIKIKNLNYDIIFGVLKIDNKSFNISSNNSLDLDINKNKEYHNISFINDSKDIFANIDNFNLDDNTIILSLNRNKNFRKLSYLISNLDDFSCYFLDNYDFYILKEGFFEKYSLIKEKNFEKVSSSISLNSCKNINSKIIVSNKDLFYIYNGKIINLKLDVELENFKIVKISNKEYLIFYFKENKLKSVRINLENSSLEYLNYETSIKVIDNIYNIEGNIILNSSKKLYNIALNNINLIGSFDFDLLFSIKNKLFSIKESSVNIFENNVFKKLYKLPEINLDNFLKLEFLDFLLLTSKHIKNKSIFYIITEKEIIKNTVLDPNINIKNYFFTKLDKYQYLFFNKKKFQENKVNFYLFTFVENLNNF